MQRGIASAASAFWGCWRSGRTIATKAHEEDAVGPAPSTWTRPQNVCLPSTRILEGGDTGPDKAARFWRRCGGKLVAREGLPEFESDRAHTIAAANQVLDRYRPNHNRRFAVGPREATPAWRPVPKSIDLDRVCSFYYEATVGNDNAVRVQGVVIDIPPGPGRCGYARAKVEVRQLLDSSWRVYYRNALIATGSRPRRRGKDTPSNVASA